ncbi:laccase-2-like [Rhagoletis pomonella]|uniref:laccase-2-like n=1 Tax=Rhagoletis pomonella TaxID=28610 RepID=UPI0017815953|nr:laccase-2-like [Rhagoletis pomonella]
MYRNGRSCSGDAGNIAIALLWLTALSVLTTPAAAAITTNTNEEAIIITNKTTITIATKVAAASNPQIPYTANRKINPNTLPWLKATPPVPAAGATVAMPVPTTATLSTTAPASTSTKSVAALGTASVSAKASALLVSMPLPLSFTNAANYFTLAGKFNPVRRMRHRHRRRRRRHLAAAVNAAVAVTTLDSNPNTSSRTESTYRSNNKNSVPFTTPLNVSQHAGELCNRPCVAGDSRICYFKFALEHYQVMGVACGRCSLGITADCFTPQCILADGYEKGVMSINRQLPGPAILVCRDDLIVVDVANQALGTAAAIHWHGQHMVATPWSDGVPFVTQCPIHFANTFRYYFWATEVGTHFYHSHSGHHKVNGQYGALIIRDDPVLMLNTNTYDLDLPEHYILISDWMHTYGEQYFPGEPSTAGIFPDSVLINGRGIYYTKDGVRAPTVVPPMRYYVIPGKRYRFRLINSISHSCPFQFQIERHNISIIASDSYDLKPRYIDTLISNAGERYDFVLLANNTVGDYWIRVRGMGVCAILPTESFALLRYVSNDPADEPDDERPLPPMPLYNETFASGVYLDHPNGTCGAPDNYCISELEALEQDEFLRTTTPDHQFFLAFTNFPVPNSEIFKNGTYYHFANLQNNLTIVGAINNLSFIFPNYPPLTQPEVMNDTQFCTELERPVSCLGNRLCPCVHRLHIHYGSIVELILVDETELVGRLHHPFHLHGHRFIVTGLGRDSSGTPMTVLAAKQLKANNLLPHNSNNTSPPFKDTVSIPSRGYAVVRFRAENPGFWLMHCHYEWHLSIGMGLILQVGNTSEMVPPPKGFPSCGNYLPELDEFEGFSAKNYFM